MTARYNPITGSRNHSRKRLFQYVRRGVMYTSLLTLANCDACKSAIVDPDQDVVVTVAPSGISIAQGSNAVFTVTVQRKGITGPVALDLFSTLPAGATMTLDPATLPSGVSTAVATITLADDALIEFASGAAVQPNVIVRAKAGDLVRYGQFKYEPLLSSAAGIIASVAPAALSIRPGQSADATVSIARLGNFKGPIDVSVFSLPEEISVTTTPMPGFPDTYRLRITVAASTLPRAIPLDFRVFAKADGIPSSSTDVLVTVVNAAFAPRVRREPRMRADEQDTVTVMLGRGIGFTAPITLSIENPPAGVTGSFSANPALDDASVLTLQATASVPAGRYAVQVRGVPQSGSGAAEQTVTVNFTVDPPLAKNAYTLVPPAVSVVAGNNTSSIFSVNRSSGFAAPVNVTLARADGSPLPTGLTLSLDQNPITQSVTTIRVNTSAATPPGTYVMKATGTAANAVDVTANFNVVVTAPPRATSISIAKLVNGTPQAVTFETVGVGGTVALLAVVLDQNGQPMPNAPVTWSSSNTAVATVNNSGVVNGVAPGTSSVTATSTADAALKASAGVLVVPAPTTNVARVELEPGNAEITAPATQQYLVALFDGTGTRMNAETGGTFEYTSSNPAVATINAATGLATGVSAGIATITVRYLRNGVPIRQASSPLTVYAAGSAGHYGSAFISTNSNNTRTVRAGQPLLFQLFVYNVAGIQQPTGVTPAPRVEPSNRNVITITPSAITGGYFFTMTVAPGAVVGTTVIIRYDVTGAGGEIVMTVVP